MSKKKNKADDTRRIAQLTAELKELRRTVEHLANVVRELDGRPRQITAGALEVVNARGEVVASISDKGHLYCRSVWASTDPNVRGVFLDGRYNGRVSAARLSLLPGSGNKAGLDATCTAQGGRIDLRSLVSKQGLDLRSSGAPFIAYEKDGGAGTVILASNGPNGGTLTLSSADPADRSKAVVHGSHRSRSGKVFLNDRNDLPVAQLPEVALPKKP